MYRRILIGMHARQHVEMRGARKASSAFDPAFSALGTSGPFPPGRQRLRLLAKVTFGSCPSRLADLANQDGLAEASK